jgi:hypothetical protein
VVQRAARRGDHHVDPSFEGLELPADRLPAVDREDPGAEVPPVAVHRLRHLHGELARGDEHQGRRLVAPVPPGDALQDRQRERRRLPGPRRRLPEQVAPLEQRRDRRPLDRRGFLVAEARERAEQLGTRHQVGERGGVPRWV